MISKQRLGEQLELQDRLNSTVNPEWLTAGYAWHRAIYMEAAEYLEHLGWKWWKKSPQDLAQAQLELVDIWHFILSHHLVKAKGDENVAVININDELRHPTNAVFVGYHTKAVDNLTWTQAVDAFVSLASGEVIELTLFNRLMSMSGLTWDELHIRYMAKNVLNIFRQMHGYKDGEYVKEWLGEEDNVVLMRLITERPDATVDQLFSRLETLYSRVLEAA